MSVSGRLEKILRKYYPNLATELTDEGRKAQKLKREKYKYLFINGKNE